MPSKVLNGADNLVSLVGTTQDMRLARYLFRLEACKELESFIVIGRVPRRLVDTVRHARMAALDHENVYVSIEARSRLRQQVGSCNNDMISHDRLARLGHRSKKIVPALGAPRENRLLQVRSYAIWA